jgi:hypothetical protein
MQSTAPVTPDTTSSETFPSAPAQSPPTGTLETSLASQVPEISNDAKWPPAFPRGSPIRWSDLADESDVDEDAAEQSIPWHPQEHQHSTMSALIPSFSETRAADVRNLTSAFSSSLSPEESPTPLISQSFIPTSTSQTSPVPSSQPLQQGPVQQMQPEFEPVHTTIGFNLPWGPVLEHGPASGGLSTTPRKVGFTDTDADTPGVNERPAWDRASLGPQTQTGPSGSPKSSPLPSDAGPVRRHGYAGALSMLYSAADASNDRSIANGFEGGSVIQPRVEAVLPVDNDEAVWLLPLHHAACILSLCLFE